MWPYTTNPIRDTIGRTRNWDDSLNIFNDSHGPEGEYNPIFRAEKLGAVIDQGLVAFITMVRRFYFVRVCSLMTRGIFCLCFGYRASIRVLHMIIGGKADLVPK